MKGIKVVALSAAGLSAMVAVVAGWLMGSVAANSELKAEAVADANGNLHVPDAYRTTYQFLRTWAVAAEPGPRFGRASCRLCFARNHRRLSQRRSFS